MRFLEAFFGDESKKAVKKILPLVEKISALEKECERLSPEDFPKKTEDFKRRFLGGETVENILPEAFALVREAAKRTLKERHFDVQLIGGVVLHEGGIAEMRTGEGKTLVATLPAYLNALTGKGVHVVTVNDYLSRRDAVWMGQIYDYLGVSVGVLNHVASYIYDAAHREKDEERDETGSFHVVHEFLRPVSKKEAYAADITYGTNNEFGFDYLRDNIAYSPEEVVQRGWHYAIVDEIDSILIDEARTPLIISAPAAESEDLYAKFSGLAGRLVQDEDYTVDEKFKQIVLTESGINKAEKALGIGNIYTEKGIKYVHHLETAVRAKALFHLDRDYVVRDGEIIIVDEFTGRLQPGRRWSEGLHQAIEAKEGVRVQKESRTLASITFQNYFRFYEKLSGMSGTAETSAEEFGKVYNLHVVTIPTHRPIARADKTDLIFQTERGKFKAISRKIKELNEKGQPVLVGTVSIEKNEVLSEYLKREGVRHELLNAKNHEREGEIIAQAGRLRAVTIATNMAGRGVDIKLGGNPLKKEDYEKVKELGGLYVLGTERHEARRIDNQLRGRSGRQGDPGETQFFVSLEDPLMRVFASDAVKNMMGKFGIPEDEPIDSRLVSKALESAQAKIEGHNFDMRKNVLQYDDVLNHQRSVIYKRRRNMLMGNVEVAREYIKSLVGDDVELLSKIKEREEKLGGDVFYKVMKGAALQTIDSLWMEHLEVMDYLRSSVNLRAYGQRDPLVEYKKEGLRLFKEMEAALAEQLFRIIEHAEVVAKSVEEKEKALFDRKSVREGFEGEEAGVTAGGHVSSDKVGRNDPCPCGSGKKYKKCGMLNTEEHRKLSAAG